jgi:hypothetical protein
MVVAPGVALTVQILRACSEAESRASCDDRRYEPEACMFRGTLPLHAPCAFAAQCASSACAFDQGKACGRCVDEKPKKQGESCVVGYECDRGMTCIDQVCAPFKRFGEACEVLGCARGLQCANGKCVPYAKVGEACEDYPGLSCAPEGKCVAGVCVARAAPKPSGEHCDDALDCIDFSCVRFTCAALGEAGAPCGEYEVTAPCASGLVCADGKCTPLDANACK